LDLLPLFLASCFLTTVEPKAGSRDANSVKIGNDRPEKKKGLPLCIDGGSLFASTINAPLRPK
jgi:hypothetical protein